jgi:hypothetical protein
MKIFIFVFKHRFRQSALNNILKRKKIKNNYILNFSGPLRYYFFNKIFFLINFFFKNNFCLISCDGQPKLYHNGINLWFGGTSQKLEKLKVAGKNNCFVFDNFIKKEKNLVNFYPTITIKKKINKEFKIVFVGNISYISNKFSKKIWHSRKFEILNNFRIIEQKKFWKIYKYKDNMNLLEDYLNIKNILRYEILSNLYNKFPDKVLLVGKSWNKFPNYMSENFNKSFLKNIYGGNLCLDFGSKWGDNCLYPRSIEIIENGGFILQSKQKNQKKTFGKVANKISFNSLDSLLAKINFIINDPDSINKYNNYIHKRFKNENFNDRTLKKIFDISKS